jgi:hypothetical protein
MAGKYDAANPNTWSNKLVAQDYNAQYRLWKKNGSKTGDASYQKMTQYDSIFKRRDVHTANTSTGISIFEPPANK